LQLNQEPQKQLSKEFVRQWLIDNEFQGKEGQQVPSMTPEIVASISARYKELYAQFTATDLPMIDYESQIQRIEQNILNSVKSVNLEA
jgi:phosphoribosylaminoimidazole-succinocarboxamide synthase